MLIYKLLLKLDKLGQKVISIYFLDFCLIRFLKWLCNQSNHIINLQIVIEISFIENRLYDLIHDFLVNLWSGSIQWIYDLVLRTNWMKCILFFFILNHIFLKINYFSFYLKTVQEWISKYWTSSFLLRVSNKSFKNWTLYSVGVKKQYNLNNFFKKDRYLQFLLQSFLIIKVLL